MSASLLVMSRALPGREADYIEWYRSRHLPDMKKVPGVIAGQFYRLAEPKPEARWAHAARYHLDRPILEVLGAVFSRAGGAEMPLTDAIDPQSVLMLGATPRGPRRIAHGAAAGPDAADDLYIVLTNPVEGQEETYNAWYDEQHLGDLLSIPGFVAAQRFTLAPETARRPSPWSYLALYEVAAGRSDAAFAEMRGRAGGPQMPISPALATDDVYAELFEPAL